MLKKSFLDFFNSRDAAHVRIALRFSNTRVFEKRAALPCAAFSRVFINTLLNDDGDACA